MGAWGYFSMQNDCAMDWVAQHVEMPLIQAIIGALRRYVDSMEGDDTRKHEAEAALALLIDLSSVQSIGRYTTIDLSSEAQAEGVWDLAIDVANKLLLEDQWLALWNEPEKKRQILRELLSLLQQHRSQEGNPGTV
jgi:hypothetical protein